MRIATATLASLVSSLLALWVLTGLYFGVAMYMASKALESVSVHSDGSAEYSGLKFVDEGEVMRFMKQETLGEWFPWAPDIPAELVPLLMAASFGLIGGAFAVVKSIAADNGDMSRSRYISRPLFGATVGFMVFALSFVIPAILTTGRTATRTETVVGIALSGGLFAERTYSWLESRINTFFADKARRK